MKAAVYYDESWGPEIDLKPASDRNLVSLNRREARLVREYFDLRAEYQALAERKAKEVRDREVNALAIARAGDRVRRQARIKAVQARIKRRDPPKPPFTVPGKAKAVAL